ncbi:protein LURP-one-related 8-like [Curcuma longa]|uniref:protein LURP-one-related 8-like n=1 Tax=Curcuma longa TaxID=136217 RepID=UPI003D9E8507
MAKVHPNTTPAASAEETPGASVVRKEDGGAVSLTVWRKSLLFGCSGFTVFDSKGDLVFRVDVYGSAAGALVLMDSCGNPLLTLRRKKLSLGATWLIFDGEDTVDPVYSVKRQVSLRHGGALAHMKPRRLQGRVGVGGGGYEIKGSYARRSCRVYDEGRRAVAEVRRKEPAGGAALGGDVFRLVVESDFDACLAMAVVILLDQMFG